MQAHSPSGLQAVPYLQWGSHLTQFFGSGDELRDLLVPYFKAGLENNESCLWVTGSAFNAEDARAALRAAVPDLDRRERNRQIEIANAEEWYAAGQKLQPNDILAGLLQREQDALRAGFIGLRTNGNCAWVSRDQWDDFQQYEVLVHQAVRGRRLICMCSYCVDQFHNGEYQEVMARHDMVVQSALRPPVRRSSAIGAPVDVTPERQKRTFDLAMTASQMGTWRYTLADNVCFYDDNAQQLYGLSEARFLHDEEGVKDKFHPDDLELMWSRVAGALDPASDGRYDVEYRVKQADGRWRWLSAWGLVEFDGDGPERKPVAIAGASRDLTEQKQAEELQRLLLNESNHRVKNTFATIQAINAQTLRSARDLPSAKQALDHRIRALAQAHDLLTSRSWAGANLNDLAVRTLEAFAPTQVTMFGDPVDVSPKHALALSLALHELATNAIKYGALSCPEGRVSLKWHVHRGTLHLDWEESGGPRVVEPTRKGFGSRLLEQLVAGDLGGHTKLDYAVSGVRCNIAVSI
ncbi:MAG TPA: MEDS domain-containing protein [Rhizomicrobium sp.]|jgi:two-component sensor histidine kinase/PAS domain-containing protein|nr:MEDS domain-containing protein [Rhizomicrobium sp.]